jgi:RNA polymerase sigma factor (sigma-70 family)
MASGHYGAVVQHLQRLFGLGTVAGLTEWQLLHRYVSRRDEVAFEALVARHGPMVLGVCRRVLDDSHDVEDAFQATFLVLVRKAASLRERDVLGHWLYGVAFRVALRARSNTGRRRARERSGGETEAMQPETDSSSGELRRVIDEELARLPDRYRRPVVLCYLQGLTHTEAAEQLHWPIGTVKGRLARARDLLRERLTRRGMALPAGAVAAVLSSDASAAVPPTLLLSTVKAAMLVAAGKAAVSGAVSAQAAALFEGVLNAMFLTKLKLTAALLACGLMITGAGVLAVPALRGAPGNQDENAAPAPAEQAQPAPSTASEAAKRQARKGAANARNKTAAGEITADKIDIDLTAAPTDLKRVEATAQARLKAAQRAYEMALLDWQEGRITTDRFFQNSKFILDAQRDLSPSKTDTIAAFQAHLDRIKTVEKHERAEVEIGRVTLFHLAEAEYYVREAEYWLERAKAGEDPTRTGKASTDEPGKDPRSLAVLAKLKQPIPMAFADETPLEDVLRYIKSATSGPNDNGIQIYVDPEGLKEAEKTMQSPVVLDLEGVPLERTLDLVVRQLGLFYAVQDGMVYISSNEDYIHPGPPVFGDSPLRKLQKRAMRGELNPEEAKQFIEMLRVRKEMMELMGARNAGGMQPRPPGNPQ